VTQPSNLRFVATIVLIAATAVFLYARTAPEIMANREPLASFPKVLDNRASVDVPIAQDVLDILGKGDFLLRIYRGPGQTDVDLFVAYFASQRAGETIHSPKNCLPGSGWSPVESKQVEVHLPGVAPFPANQYIIARGSDRRLVLYWYHAHNRAVASEYWAKFYLVADAIRFNRSDGSLVRMTTPLGPGESADSARQRLMGFASSVVPELNRFIPR
jgi:EpsI family protein